MLATLAEPYFDATAQQVLDRISHVIFVGCPHPTDTNRDQWPMLAHVLRHDRKADDKTIKTAMEEVPIAVSMCTKVPRIRDPFAYPHHI